MVTFGEELELGHLLPGEPEDGGEDGDQAASLLPAQPQELQDHILHVFQVLDMLVALLASLVRPDFLFQDLM